MVDPAGQGASKRRADRYEDRTKDEEEGERILKDAPGSEKIAQLVPGRGSPLRSSHDVLQSLSVPGRELGIGSDVVLCPPAGLHLPVGSVKPVSASPLRVRFLLCLPLNGSPREVIQPFDPDCRDDAEDRAEGENRKWEPSLEGGDHCRTG